MAPGNEDEDRPWDDALIDAFRDRASDPTFRLFHEEREDLRVVSRLDQIDECIHSRLAGLAYEQGNPSEHRFLSDPDPEDARRLVAGQPPSKRRPRHLPGMTRLDVAEAVAAVERICLELCRGLMGGISIQAKIHWVSFIQSVRVGRPGSPVRHDERRGTRVRLSIRREGHGTSTVEKASGPGDPINPRALAEAALNRLSERSHAVSLGGGAPAAVFAPGAGGVLFHELVGHALEADVIEEGGSMLARLDGPITSPEVLVIDDPCLGRSPWRWDDEGEEAREVFLVRGRRVSGWIHDSRSAARRGVTTNGHGRRSSFTQRVLPRMGCTFLAPGPLAPDEVLEGLDQGVFVRRMETASVDPRNGRATFGVTDADRIVHGKIEAPLQPFLIEVSVVEVLPTIDRIANDLAFDTCIGSCIRDGQPLATSVGAPTFRTGLVRVVP